MLRSTCVTSCGTVRASWCSERHASARARTLVTRSWTANRVGRRSRCSTPGLRHGRATCVAEPDGPGGAGLIGLHDGRAVIREGNATGTDRIVLVDLGTGEGVELPAPPLPVSSLCVVGDDLVAATRHNTPPMPGGDLNNFDPLGASTISLLTPEAWTEPSGTGVMYTAAAGLQSDLRRWRGPRGAPRLGAERRAYAVVSLRAPNRPMAPIACAPDALRTSVDERHH